MKFATRILLLAAMFITGMGSAFAQCSVNAGPDQTICGAGPTIPDVTLTASVSGGVAPITYTWNNSAGTGASALNFNISAGQVYTISIQAKDAGTTGSAAFVATAHNKSFTSTR